MIGSFQNLRVFNSTKLFPLGVVPILEQDSVIFFYFWRHLKFYHRVMALKIINYRQANDNDFDLTFTIKTNSSKQLVEKIWGWDNPVQIDYHKRRFNPNKTKIIIYENNQVGYISMVATDDTIFIENILIDISFQGKGIGTKVILDTIKIAVSQNKNIELQVFKINESAIRLYERLDFKTFEQTDLHYKMRYKSRNKN